MSREAELYKDKIEVSLDGRQIFYLFFGGAVIVGLVFVLGVMVGRRVEARGHTDRARVAATVDPLAALDRLEGGNGLSFQGALRGDEGPVSDVEKTIAAQQKDLGPRASDLGHKAEAKKEEPKVDKKDEPKLEKEEPKLEKNEEPKVEKKDEAKIEKMEEPKLAKKEEPKVEKKDQASDAAEKKAEEPKEKKQPKYVLQLSSFQDKSEAQSYLDQVKSAGYQAYLTEASVDGKQYFRVRLGSYKTIEAAYDAKAEVEKSTKKSSIIIKL